MKNVIKMTLLDAPQEVWLRVTEFKDKKLQDKLAGHGMFIGDRLRVLREAPLKGPLMIDLNGRQIALGREVVKKILVETE
jgi:ferrous iron transport protein A